MKNCLFVGVNRSFSRWLLYKLLEVRVKKTSCSCHEKKSEQIDKILERQKKSQQHSGVYESKMPIKIEKKIVENSLKW